MKVHSNTFLKTLFSRSEDVHPNNLTKISVVCVNSPNLNEAIRSLLPKFQPISEFTFCCDGAANRVYNEFKNDESELQRLIPSHIVGDLDSLSPNVRQYYEGKGVKIIQDLDQDSNDLDKALGVLSALAANHAVFILGGLGGRFDQEMSTLHALYKWKGQFERLILLDENSTTFLLEGGFVEHIIKPIRCYEGDTSIDSLYEGKYCGLIPLGKQATDIQTFGLQWNLDHGSLEFGRFISSSNTIPSNTKEVKIISDEDIIWTCTYRDCD